MAFNDTEKTDAKIEQAYLDLLAKTLSAAKEKWSEPWLRSIVNFNPQGFDGARYSGMNNFVLALSDMANGYSTPIHVTFACAQNEGERRVNQSSNFARITCRMTRAKRRV